MLISKRVQLCDKRHKKHQLHLLSPSMSLGQMTETEQLLLSLMPPRKRWVSLSTKTRYRELDDGHRQRNAAARCNWKAIKWTIKRDLADGGVIPYLTALKEFVNKIQKRVREEHFAFEVPLLFPDVKDETSCRPLCKFESLEDSVILILANKYLTELFDSLFYEESLAFRCKRDYHGENDCVTAHHHAIVRMKEYRERFEGKRLYVSECDLQKFYDTVSHRVVRKCYYGLLKKAAKENPGLRFDEITRVFEAYLKCYNFPKNVFCKNGDKKFWEGNKIDEKQRCFKWVDTILLAKSRRGLMHLQIGVPQGGALSGLIANMVLNSVDWQVKKEMKWSDLYLRYCDDMIIISTSVNCHRKVNSFANES